MDPLKQNIETAESHHQDQAKPVRLLASSLLRGCNVHHTSTVIRQDVDFGDLAGMQTGLFGPDFAERFVDSFGSLRRSLPGSDFSEAFLQRLHEAPGVPIEEILLETIVAIEAALAFERGRFDVTMFGMFEPGLIPGQVTLCWSSIGRRISRRAAELGLSGVMVLLPPHHRVMPAPDLDALEEAFAMLRRSARRRRPTAAAAALALAARERGMACQIVGGDRLRLGQGAFQRPIVASVSPLANSFPDDKREFAQRLLEIGLPVPQLTKTGIAAQSSERTEDPDDQILVTLPLRHDDGQTGVIKHRVNSVVEQKTWGHDYSLLVVDGRFVSAVRRLPPIVQGDGKRTIQGLIDDLNLDPFRDDFRMMQIIVDDGLIDHLGSQACRLDEILPAGKVVSLGVGTAVADGGAAIDVTNEIHADNKDMAERVAKTFALDLVSVDFVTTDISKSYKIGIGHIAKVSVEPDLHSHFWLRHGEPKTTAAAILRRSWKEETDGHVPTVLVAGDRGTGRIAREFDAIIRGSGRISGLVMRDTAYLNGEALAVRQSRRRRVLRMLLNDPRVEALVGAVSLRQTVKHGLQLDGCQVAAIANRAVERDADLFRQGIDVMVRATSGPLVVSADNAVAVQALRGLDRRRLILVSTRRHGHALEQHLAEGGTAITTMWQDDQDRIVVLRDSETILSLPTDAPDHTRSGREAGRSSEAKLYALALAHGLGLSEAEIVQAMSDAPKRVTIPKREKRRKADSQSESQA